MLFYCSKCRENTESKNPKVVKTKNGRIMVSSNCMVCGSEKPKFIEKQEASSLLSSFSQIPLSQIPSVGTLLF